MNFRGAAASPAPLTLPARPARVAFLAFWALWALLLLGGCAAVPGLALPGMAPPHEVKVVTEPAPPRLVRIEIVAPDGLRELLERHLDLVRLGALAGIDAIDSTEWARLIQATPAQVRDLLQTEGHFAPTTTIERLAGDGAAVPERVRVLVEPGPASTISRVTLEAEGELQSAAEAGDPHAAATLADFRRAWPLDAGTDFRNPAWSAAKAGALARLRAAGYASASWSGTGAQVDAQQHTVRLFLVVDSGPLFRFGELQIDGLAAQDAQTVRNLAAIDIGTPVTETLLLDFQERLQRAGLFDSVAVTLNPNPARAEAAVVRVNVREAPLQVYTFGIGVDANTGPRVSVEHVYRRVFGMPVTARNKFEWGTVRQAWDGEISTHPGERQYRNLIGGAVERLEGTDDVVLAQRLRVGRAKETQRVERLAFVEAERSSRRTDTRAEETVALSANYHAIWRRLDSVLLPTEGYSLSAQGGVGHSRGTESANGPFSRAYGRLTGYRPLGGNWFGQARIEAGQVFASSNISIPDSQLFRAGGEDSVRGYSYRSLGPEIDGAVSGGRVLLTGSLEVARPLLASLPSVWGALFIDGGRAAESFSNFDAAMGYGFGVRWRSPVGPLRMDVAWADETQKFRLHFSVGITY